MISAIIVEDLQRERQHIEKILKKNFTDIILTASCGTYAEAAVALENYKPQLLLFDIELDGGKLSFELLNNYENNDSEFVFISAHDHYALQAIEMSYCDYVLKPYSDIILIAAIERAKKRIYEKDSFNRIEILLKNLKSKEPSQKTIVLPNTTPPHNCAIIPVNNILYVASKKDHTSLFVAQASTPDKKIFHSVLSKGVGKIAEQLEDNTQFVRAHSQYIVNTAFITGYNKADCSLIMYDSKSIPIARERKQALMHLLSLK